MFFEDEQNKTKVVIEVDKKRAAVFDYFLETLNMTPAQAFDEMLGALATKTGSKTKSNEYAPSENKIEDKRLSVETISSRIKKWAREKDSYPHIMLEAYFNASFNLQEKVVWRKKMELYFNSRTNSAAINRFISVFRQMSSSSLRAYGDVFVYDRYTDNVSLNETYIELITSLKDQFDPSRD